MEISARQPPLTSPEDTELPYCYKINSFITSVLNSCSQLISSLAINIFECCFPCFNRSSPKNEEPEILDGEAIIHDPKLRALISNGYVERLERVVDRMTKEFSTTEGKLIEKKLSNMNEQQRTMLKANIDSQYICPISKEIIQEPLKGPDEHYYERYILRDYYKSTWIAEGNECLAPFDRTKVVQNPGLLPIEEEVQQIILDKIKTFQANIDK